MIQKAIEKINKEMEQKKDHPYIQAIGEMLLRQIEINKDAAEKIGSGTTTIEESYKAVESMAKKKARNGCCGLTYNEVLNEVKKYYKFEAVQDKMLQVEMEEIKEDCNVKVEEVKSNVVKVNFSANLSD
ncbi:MAG: hypothetical protein ACRC68_05010, partial [Clostridium sp.]